MSKKQMNKEAGFMGLEGMGALLFYLVMLAGAALLIVQLFSGGKLSETEKALSSLRMGIQQLYTAQGNYDGLQTSTVGNAGILPKGFAYDTTAKAIKTPWDTNITVAPVDKEKFSITVVTPADECVKLATYDANAWLETAIGTNVIKTVADAETQCTTASGDDGDDVSLIFTAK